MKKSFVFTLAAAIVLPLLFTPKASASLPYVGDIAFRAGSGFAVSENGYIYLVAGDTVPSVLSQLESAVGVSVTDKNGAAVTEGAVGTGWKLIRSSGGSNYEHTFILPGDLDGSGTVNPTDVIIAKRIVLGSASAEGAAASAFDANGDGRYDVSDYVALKRHMKGGEVYPKHNAAPEVSDMVFTKEQDGSLKLSERGGASSLTFVRDGGGAWNLGVWSVGGVKAAGGSSWEFAVTASDAENGLSVSSGCAYGHEKLIQAQFSDAYDGKSVVPSKDVSYDVKILKLVEKSQLYIMSADYPFAAVTRTYIITAGRISLELDFEFTDSVWIKTLNYPYLPSYTSFADSFVTYGSDGAAVTAAPGASVSGKGQTVTLTGKSGSAMLELYSDGGGSTPVCSVTSDGKCTVTRSISAGHIEKGAAIHISAAWSIYDEKGEQP